LLIGRHHLASLVQLNQFFFLLAPKFQSMESIISLTGDGFVMIAADVANARSVVVMKDDMDKIQVLDDHKLLAAAGTPGDVAKFTEHVTQDLRLYQLRSGLPMSTAAAANFTRGELARFLRKSPYQCNIMLAGYDAAEEISGASASTSLYSIDYLGTLIKIPFGAEGYAQYFVLSALDRLWKKNLTEAEALKVLKTAIAEVQKRLVINQPRFSIKIVDKDGVRILEAADISTPGPGRSDAMVADPPATVA
jgi:20S proteasome subunit beta 4